LHVEKIAGLSYDREGIKFIANYVKPTGIVTTKNSLIKLAKKFNLLTIQRLFLIDTDAFKNGITSVIENQPDAVEIMPARIPQLVKELSSKIDVPVITGGLLENREQMLEALNAGARAVSTGNPQLWKEVLY